MTKNQIIAELSEYFSVKELVCPHTYARFGEDSWRFLDERLLETLLVLRRDILKTPMIVNNGRNFTQRGLRCNMCQLVKSKTKAYLSAHIFGKAVDFDARNMSASQVRLVIKANVGLLPCPIRLEDDVNWVHIDVMNDSNEKIQMFSV